MTVDLNLFDKRLIVVSGKGGVGKTVTSSALGMLASAMGKSVLLVKVDDQGRTGALFDCPPLTDKIAPLRENISAVNLDPATVVADYFTKQIKVRWVVQHLMNSALFQNWFRVSPAIKEMILLGKIWDLVEERSWWRNKPVWDLVIFDAPATGHGLGYLGLPEQASKLLLGPMRKNALGVQAMLENAKTTSLLLVTLPEEMPVNETVHFYERAKADLRVPLAGVVLNQVAPDRIRPEQLATVGETLAQAGAQAALETLLGQEIASGGGGERAFRAAAEYSVARRALSEEYGDRLRDKIPDVPLIEVPYVFSETFGYQELQAVSGELQRAIERAKRGEQHASRRSPSVSPEAPREAKA